MDAFFIIAGIVAGIMLLCGGIEGIIAFKTDKKMLLLPLPILCGTGCVYVFVQTIIITGWDRLFWDVLLICALCVFIGTMIGWASGNEKRKKRRPAPATPKEDL